MTDNWMWMVHGNLFLRYNWQDVTNKSDRGDRQFDAPNWIMGMGQRKIGARGLFRLSAMLSLDPLTVGEAGYPLLFQTGETYKGRPIVDRQHPHDLFSELSVAYTHLLSRDVDITAYLGWPGEPALGPVAFMHRNSALNNPDAPLGHHWQDATHITYGVGSLGIRAWIFKAEGSIFSGREPDENRYGLDRPRFDSYSWRLLCNPFSQLALQFSQAWLKHPDGSGHHGDEDVRRTTASAIHHLPFGLNRYLATTLAWGNNNGHMKSSAWLAETNLQFDRVAVYARYERVKKNAMELDLQEFHHHDKFNINALTLGVNHVLFRGLGLNTALGAQGTLFTARGLESVYGKNPLSAEIYLRVYPALMQMRHHTGRRAAE